MTEERVSDAELFYSQFSRLIEQVESLESNMADTILQPRHLHQQIVTSLNSVKELQERASQIITSPEDREEVNGSILDLLKRLSWLRDSQKLQSALASTLLKQVNSFTEPVARLVGDMAGPILQPRYFDEQIVLLLNSIRELQEQTAQIFTIPEKINESISALLAQLTELRQSKKLQTALEIFNEGYVTESPIPQVSLLRRFFNFLMTPFIALYNAIWNSEGTQSVSEESQPLDVKSSKSTGSFSKPEQEASVLESGISLRTNSSVDSKSSHAKSSSILFSAQPPKDSKKEETPRDSVDITITDTPNSSQRH